MTDKLPGVKFLIFVIICTVFSAWLVGVIGNISFEDRTTYEAAFDDVFGLLVADDVKVSGVTVGKVLSMRAEDGNAVVTFEVNDTLTVGPDSHVEVRWRSILGQRYLYVAPSGDTDASKTVPAGETFQFPREQTTSPANLGVLLDRLVPIMTALNPEQSNLVVQALSEALVGREDEVRDLIRQGAELTQALASRDQQIGSLLDNAATVVDAYANREDQIRRLLDSFAGVSETIAGRNDELEATIIQLADTQRELRRLVEANDGEIRGTLSGLDAVTTVLSVNRERLDAIAEFMYRGIIAYHVQSRYGQWFNVNGVGVSMNEEFVSSDRGGRLTCNNPDGCSGSAYGPGPSGQQSSSNTFATVPQSEDGSGSLATFFGARTAAGGAS